MSDPTDLPNLIDWSKVRVCRVMDLHATKQLCECPPDDCARERPFATVPPTQPPAAPETDVSGGRIVLGQVGEHLDNDGLTEAEVATLHRLAGSRSMPTAMLAEIERLIAERVRVVEGERDAVVEVGAYAQQKGATARAVNDAARMAQAAARRTRELAAMTARAESAEAAHAALVAAVEALADVVEAEECHKHHHQSTATDECTAAALRALAGGAR